MVAGEYEVKAQTFCGSRDGLAPSTPSDRLGFLSLVSDESPLSPGRLLGKSLR